MVQSGTGGRLETILTQVRQDGGRITPARRAVVKTLLEGGEHVSADDIAAHVQAAMPDVAVSTVYRTLDVLERLGVVEHVHLGHGPSLYHLADRHHVHLVCRNCESVIEVPDDYLHDVAGRLEAEHGFTLEAHHFALLGRCADCARSD